MWPFVVVASGKREAAFSSSRPKKSSFRQVGFRIQTAAICFARTNPAQRLFYLDHRTVDGQHNIIAGTHVAPGNVHDRIPYLGRLDRQRERFGF